MKKDLLKKVMRFQEKNNHLHTIDYRMIEKGNTFNELSKGLNDKLTGLFSVP